jgi:thioesterase domain-containing protein/aryl carrier-like protein
MVPSDVIPLSVIPLSANGKIERGRLPAPSKRMSVRERTYRSAEEERLAAIWADLLGQRHVDPEEDFFDLGGHSVLMAVLRHRIHSEFGQLIPLAELIHSRTVREQVKLTQRALTRNPELPPGVVALQPNGTGNSIFWIQYPIGNLMAAIGEHHPLIFVALTEEDLASLGNSPTLQSIATCFLRKILMTQPKGPYSVGGLCVGGILAYEIASQLRTAGHEVTLLILLDAPNPAYIAICESLPQKFNYLLYLLKRSNRLGIRKSVANARRRLLKRFAPKLRTNYVATEMRAAHEMIEVAVNGYEPQRYDSKVLLLQASERPPHVNFLKGWQIVIARDLHSQYVHGHHNDLVRAADMRHVAEAILSHLA